MSDYIEIALKRQTERAEAAEAELEAVRDDNHAMMLEIDGMRTELAKLAQQKPVMKYMGRRLTPKDTMESWGIDCDVNVRPEMGTPLYTSPVHPPHKGATHCDDCGLTWLDDGLNPLRCPYCKDAVPAPAVPDWNVNIERIRDVMHMLGISIDESVECFSAALPTNINRMTLAMKRHLQGLAGMTAATAPSVPEEWRDALATGAKWMRHWLSEHDCECETVHTCGHTQRSEELRKMEAMLQSSTVVAAPASITTTPFIPDDDTRRNDAEFAATIRRKFTSGNSVQVESIRISRDEARALLQSADHSERNLEKVAPDCRACANRGRINGLSQESYCDSCIYQGRDWRENHFVDASKTADTAKRRCEACAILPCSCK